MTSTTTKITFEYPGADEKCSTEDGFVKAYAKLSGTGKKFNIEVKEHKGRIERTKDSVIRIDLILSESEKMTGYEVAEVVAKYAPSVYPKITTHTPVSSIKCSMTLSNCNDAWIDVCRNIYRHNRDLFKTVSDVEEAIIKRYLVEFGQSTTEVEFNSAFFNKICKIILSDKKFDQEMDRVKAYGEILTKLADADRYYLDELVKKNLIVKEQYGSLVKQAGEHYYAWTPASGEDKEKFIFQSLSDGKKAPGRIAKVQGGTKAEYIKYKQVSSGVYNRTVSEDGKVILSSTTTTKEAPKADDNGIATVSRKAVHREELTDNDKIIIAKYEKLMSDYNIKNIPKSDHGKLQKARELVANGRL